MKFSTSASPISLTVHTVPTNATLVSVEPKTMEVTFPVVPASALDHFVPGAIHDFMPAFRATFDDEWPRDVSITISLTARPSSPDEIADAGELEDLEPDTDPFAPANLVENWLGQVVERFALEALPLLHAVEAGDDQDLSDDELDSQYLEWLANQSEIRVKIHRRPGLPSDAFTTVDRKRSPLAPYDLSLEVLDHKKVCLS